MDDSITTTKTKTTTTTDEDRATLHLDPIHLVQEHKAAYVGDEERPLGSYAFLMGVYGLGVLGASAVVRSQGVGLPECVSARDLALISVATHKVSRMIAKDMVTSAIRAPFTRFDGTTGPAELREQTRGVGLQKALGEMLTCPFCLAQWTATSFAFGLVLAPRVTRMVAAVFVAHFVSDVLQFGYSAVEQAVE